MTDSELPPVLTVTGPAKVASPAPSKIETPLDPTAAAKSVLPSWLKSPRATELGLSPTLIEGATLKLGAEHTSAALPVTVNVTNTATNTSKGNSLFGNVRLNKLVHLIENHPARTDEKQTSFEGLHEAVGRHSRE